MSNLIHPNYRADIDGLRALAVLAVVSFHAFPDIIKGGFIGVDVFFVISGYLISTIIFSSLEKGNFSIIDFYNRRVKRIFPALTIVMVTSIFFGWFFLFSDEYTQLGKHTAGGVAFVSNFFFYKESGYFDNAVETKPMLHLWSLAVEEQFYIFWPILLTIVSTHKWSFFRITLFLFILSFFANIYLISNNLEAAFYWPIARFWELMVGAYLAYLMIEKSNMEIDNAIKNLLALSGLTLIFLGFYLINAKSQFPGWWAILPTLGSFLVIYAGPSAYLNKHVLSNKIFVWIGLISFPLYLWHWPVLSFLRIIEGPNPSIMHKCIMLFVSLMLAWITYYFIEKKIRPLQGYMPSVFLLFIALIVLLVSITIYLEGGIPARKVNEKLDYLRTLDFFNGSRGSDGSCSEMNGLNVLDGEVCLSSSKSPNVLFAGDSHAMALYSAIYGKKIPANSILISGHSCFLYPNLTLIQQNKYGLNDRCLAITEKILSFAKQSKEIKKVMLVNRSPYSNSESKEKSGYFSNGKALSNEDAFLVGEGILIEKLLSYGKEVVFVIDVPRLNYDPRDCFKRVYFVEERKCEAAAADVNKVRSNYINAVNKLKLKYPMISIFNTMDVFCDNGVCKLKDGDNYLYNDIHHISVSGSAEILKKMRESGYLN